MALPDLYIVAAGTGSRLAADVPKALVPIADEPCLTSTLQQIGHKFRRVFVVTNILVLDQWRDQPVTGYRFTRVLAAGPHCIEVEYYDRSGAGQASLYWNQN